MTDSDRYLRVLEQARRLYAQGVSFRDALAGLRTLSSSPIDSIKAGRDAFGLKLGQAKLVVHTSDAWSDCRDSWDQLHDSLERLADEH